jgi:hypothetical protein
MTAFFLSFFLVAHGTRFDHGAARARRAARARGGGRRRDD